MTSGLQGQTRKSAKRALLKNFYRITEKMCNKTAFEHVIA